MTKKEQLIGLAQRSYAEIRRFAEKLSGKGETSIGAVDHWSPRDVIVHLTEEKKRVADRLTAVRFNDKVEELPDYEELNAATWEAYKNRSLDQILQILDEAQDSLLANLEAIDEGDLLEVGRYEWLEGRPLWRYVAGVDFLHALSHLRPLYIEKGDLHYANQLCQIESRLAGPLDDSPAWQSVITYNVACNYALMGDKPKAYKKLAAALKLSSHLIEWAQKDPDLASLHDEAEFKRLITSIASH